MYCLGVAFSFRTIKSKAELLFLLIFLVYKYYHTVSFASAAELGCSVHFERTDVRRIAFVSHSFTLIYASSIDRSVRLSTFISDIHLLRMLVPSF